MPLHEPASTFQETESQQVTDSRARLGLGLFAIYFVLYAGFILLNAYAPAAMGWRPLWGLNLATIYGAALIKAAILLSLIYVWLTRRAKVVG